MEEDEKISDIVKCSTELLKVVGVDNIKPAVSEVGKTLETVTKTVNVCLSPLRATVWGYERVEDYLVRKIGTKLREVPEENIVVPDARVSVPAVQGLLLSEKDSNIREMFANLLASSMNKSHCSKVHPAYATIINQLSSVEADILNRIMPTLESYEICRYSYSGEESEYSPGVQKSRGMVRQFRDTLLEFNIDINYEIASAAIDNLTRLNVFRLEKIGSSKVNLSKDDEGSIKYSNNRTTVLVVTEFGRLLMKSCLDESVKIDWVSI